MTCFCPKLSGSCYLLVNHNLGAKGTVDASSICNPGPADQEDGNGAEDEERGGSEGAKENPSRTKSSRLQRPTFVTPAHIFEPKHTTVNTIMK